MMGAFLSYRMKNTFRVIASVAMLSISGLILFYTLIVENVKSYQNDCIYIDVFSCSLHICFNYKLFELVHMMTLTYFNIISLNEFLKVR